MDSLIDLGYWGLFIGSFLASTLIPMSADVLLVGILALGGNVWACLVIATTGNWLGGLTSYWIGWLVRWEWIERWLKVKEEKLLRQKKNINRYGVWLALFTWLPLIGDLLAVALGFYKIKPYASAIYMLIAVSPASCFGPGPTCNTENDFFKLSLFTAPSPHFHYFFLFSCLSPFYLSSPFYPFPPSQQLSFPLYVFVRARSNLCKWDMTLSY